GSLAFSSNLGGGTFMFDTFQPVMKPGALEGDFNGNGIVDAADYVVWRKTDGSQAGYDLWRASFERTTGSASGALFDSPTNAVPEPTAALMLLAGMLTIFVRRRATVS
ncbi:MAG TPA: PEP-CTERM sorting domain-containing protein, partial [Lacipirellulaceae bacterium]|nr:PEP-CTERM sorting domain-containing protein [Lacipirellulaceae bacterium]